MRRFMLAAGVACAVLLNSHVGAQLNTSSTNSGAPGMPGQAVSTYRGGPLSQVGQRLPAAAPPIGQPIANANATQRPYDPNRPYDVFKGTNFDSNSLVAPLVGPDGRPMDPPDVLDKLSDRIRSILGMLKPNPPRPPYVPGISRRNRERAQQALWRRD
jgi:hypothetical protein